MSVRFLPNKQRENWSEMRTWTGCHLYFMSTSTC